MKPFTHDGYAYVKKGEITKRDQLPTVAIVMVNTVRPEAL
jgi:hypothetical protein